MVVIYLLSHVIAASSLVVAARLLGYRFVLLFPVACLRLFCAGAALMPKHQYKPGA